MEQSASPRNREIDLEIVSSSWLSLNEPAGFDQLVESWSRKIDADCQEGDFGGLVDDIMARQLAVVEQVLGAQSETRHLDPLENAVRETLTPAMVLSPDGTVTTISEGGEDYFMVRQGRRADSNWLCEESASDFAIVRRNARQRGNAGYAILRIRTGNGETALAEAYTLEVVNYSAAFTVVRSLELDWSIEVSENLARAFNLTESEVDICQRLFRLRDLEKVAIERGVTHETSRTQLKRIFGKIAIHSKADLIRLLAMLCARSAKGKSSADLKWSDPLGREKLLIRPDGRKLAHTWIGAEHGREILFVHGEIPCFFLGDAIEAKLAAADVKMICISMPGHGNSDPAPKSKTQLDDGCAAIELLLQELCGRPIPAVGTYSGMIYPIDLGGRKKGLLSAINIIGIPFNLTEDSFQKLPLIQKTLSQLARRAPAIFELICRIGYRMMLREGPDFYLKRAFSDCEVDLRIVADADCQPLLRAACRHLVAQGHKAFFLEEVRCARVNYRDLLAELKIPLHWLVPAQAHISDADSCRVAKSMSSLVTVELVENAGELLPYQRPDLFVERMAQLVSANPSEFFAQNDHFAAK